MGPDKLASEKSADLDLHCQPNRIYLCLSATSHNNCIVARWLINVVCLYQVMMTLHFLNDVAMALNQHRN